MVVACAVIAEADDTGMPTATTPNANPLVQFAGPQKAGKTKNVGSFKLKLKGADATKIDDAVQKLLRTVKKPAVQSAPIVDAQDFIDTGVMEGSDMMEEGLEIGGMLTDDTVTRFGHDLFDAFNSAWRPPEGSSYNIIFSEQNDANRGSFISVKLNDTVIYQGFLTPRQDAINDLGKGLAKDMRNLVRNTANLENEEYY